MTLSQDKDLMSWNKMELFQDISCIVPGHLKMLQDKTYMFQLLF